MLVCTSKTSSGRSTEPDFVPAGLRMSMVGMVRLPWQRCGPGPHRCQGSLTMPTIDILSPAGTKSGSVDLPDDVFDVQTNIPLIHQVVVGQLAAARQGTHSTKTRAEVRGGGRKPHKQKGTGRARQGSTRAP